MKKRNVLTMALALVLVAVLAVGGTLAYLTDDDTQVTNTFTFANGMTVDLTEPKPEKVPGGSEKITGDPETGWNYENVTPGQDLNKKPTLSTVTTVDSYVFVKISGACADVQPKDIDTAHWTAAGTPDQFGNGIYYQKVTAVEGQPNDKYELGAIFTQVETSENPTSTSSDPARIQIDVFEIQATDITLDQAKTEAENHFNGTGTGA